MTAPAARPHDAAGRWPALECRPMTKVRALITPDLAINTATLAVALTVAEQLYKFHSFTLEAIAFLATWWGLRKVAELFRPR